MELTSLDLSVLMNELKQLEEGFVQKVYQRKDELTIEVYVPGDEKKRLILGPNYVFLSKYKRDNPERPPGFCMELRKHLGRIDSIEQRGFDRILKIKSGEYTLIAEIFGKGNMILTKNDKIIGAFRQEEWADRTIKVGEMYAEPEPAKDPREVEDIFSILEGELVRAIASQLSLGGTYAEELCLRAKIDKTKDVEELTAEEKERVQAEFDKMLNSAEEPEPVLYREKESDTEDKPLPKRAAPFQLQTYSDYEIESYDLFSEALDEYYYTKVSRRHREKKMKKYREKREGLEKQYEQQQRKIDGLKISAEQNRERAEKIYTNYQVLQEIKEAVEKGVKEHGWTETEKRIKESENQVAAKIKGFKPREEYLTVSIDDDNLKVEPFKDLEATASEYYDKAKKSEQKMENAKKALKITEERLGELDAENIEIDEAMEDKSQKRKKKWFEKYRWFYSSEDHLVVIGRDAQTNEMLVKKHMENNDLYFHADFDGAPSVVVKNGQEAGEQTIEEAAKAAVTFAKTWKAGIGADTVYHVKPEQVTKNPESGEYLTKGAFVIRGDREYMHNVKIDACVGVYNVDGVEVPVCGPKTAIESQCDSFVELKPGRTKKSDIAKKINRVFADDDYDVDLDYIIRVLPPGESEIKNR